MLNFSQKFSIFMVKPLKFYLTFITPPCNKHVKPGVIRVDKTIKGGREGIPISKIAR